MTSEPNPYAASTERAAKQIPNGATADDDARARITLIARMRAMIYDANSVIWVCPLVCFCTPLWAFMLPWFSYRLYSWHQTRAACLQLTDETASLRTGQLVARFLAARPRLIAGVAVGSIYWALIAASLFIRLTQGQLP